MYIVHVYNLPVGYRREDVRMHEIHLHTAHTSPTHPHDVRDGLKASVWVGRESLRHEHIRDRPERVQGPELFIHM